VVALRRLRPLAGRSRRYPLLWALLLWHLVYPLMGPGAQADGLWEDDRQRLNIGLKLFPACLAADQGLADKRDERGRLLVLTLHGDSPRAADTVASDLRGVGEVQGYPLEVAVVPADRLADYRDRKVAAMFLATPGMALASIVAEARGHRALVFSPFPGDVERGAVAGIQVTDRILPYVNLRQAERAQIRFKPFFLRVAASYE